MYRMLATSALVMLGLLAGGCGEPVETGRAADEAAEWGPLAVVPPPEGGGEALAGGTLRITEQCVFLDQEGDEAMLLVWPADRTAWDAASQAIAFENHSGGTVTLTDGDQLMVSGGGSSVDEGGVAAEEWVGRIEWVAPPDASCPMDTRWSVGLEIEIVSGE